MGMQKKQSEFVSMVARLVIFAESQGYELTYGDAYRDPRAFGKIGEKGPYGRKSSCHKLRLAVDFNVFIAGTWQKKGTEPCWERLGEYWESMGGSWGGRFDDANHFSLEHEGIK